MDDLTAILSSLNNNITERTCKIESYESPNSAQIPGRSTSSNQKASEENRSPAEPDASALPDSVATSTEGTGKTPVPPKQTPVPLIKVNWGTVVSCGQKNYPLSFRHVSKLPSRRLPCLSPALNGLYGAQVSLLKQRWCPATTRI